MNDLEELKNLLFGAEKQVLDTLSDRVERPETRAADVADVLPEAIRISHRGGDALATELRDPIERCLKQSFRDSPQEYADIMYPVMGPAIRKSIVHALRAFSQQINQTMEHSLSAKGLSWRLQAWRAGVPFGEYVVQQTLLFRIEQAYLISRENGLLVAHVHHNSSRIKDSDAVSAMFTAIQDFVKESFSPDRTGRLETADMGEFTLWAVHGPHALLVCVIRGVPPTALRSDLSAVLERIHFRYGDALRSYKGDTESVLEVEQELVECLAFEAQQAPREKSSQLPLPLLIVLLLAITGATYAGYGTWKMGSELERLTDISGSVPGIYLDHISSDGKVFTLHGLRDPLAPGVAELAHIAGLEPLRVRSDLRPYRSLDPEIGIRRAHAVLQPPEGVDVTEVDGGLVVSGIASRGWIDSLQAKIEADVAGVPVSVGKLEVTERVQLEERLASVDEAEFRFVGANQLIDADVSRLREYAARLKVVAADAAFLGLALDITVIGSTDTTGNRAANIRLAEQRAEVGVVALRDAGIGPVSKATRIGGQDTGGDAMNHDLRRVIIEVRLQPE